MCIAKHCLAMQTLSRALASSPHTQWYIYLINLKIDLMVWHHQTTKKAHHFCCAHRHNLLLALSICKRLSPCSSLQRNTNLIPNKIRFALYNWWFISTTRASVGASHCISNLTCESLKIWDDIVRQIALSLRELAMRGPGQCWRALADQSVSGKVYSELLCKCISMFMFRLWLYRYVTNDV